MMSENWKKKSWENLDKWSFCPICSVTLLGKEEQPSASTVVNRNDLPTNGVASRTPGLLCTTPGGVLYSTLHLGEWCRPSRPAPYKLCGHRLRS